MKSAKCVTRIENYIWEKYPNCEIIVPELEQITTRDCRAGEA